MISSATPKNDSEFGTRLRSSNYLHYPKKSIPMLDHRDGVKVIARRRGGQTSLRAELVRVAVSPKKRPIRCPAAELVMRRS
ncbi:MAG: hypothetical protein DMF32_03615 [Verrucomicrobia bacterium]|nr:MAG: hypothetical protein DMF32_03615 [Verrucomicrobiota bacterium]